MPLTTPDGLPFESLLNDEPTRTLNGGSDGLSDILAVEAQRVLSELRSQISDLQQGPQLIEYSAGSGTFVPADFPWARKVRVKVQGGGAGGGGSASTSSGEAAVGAGGGGGGYAEAIIDIAALEASVTVTVGPGGAGGAAGNNTGSAGNNSAFGAHVIGNGANGGQGGTNTGGNNVTSGGTGGGGSINTGTGFVRPGGPGHNGACDQAIVNNHGYGGDAMLGSGARTSIVNVGGAGETGGNYGGGGSGAFAFPSQGAFAGGDGAPGNVIVEVY